MESAAPKRRDVSILLPSRSNSSSCLDEQLLVLLDQAADEASMNNLNVFCLPQFFLSSRGRN